MVEFNDLFVKGANVKKPVVVVKQSEEAPVPIEVLATSIKAISEGIRKLRAGPLSNFALLLLIENAAPTWGHYPKKKVGKREIQAVLDGIESLEATYLKKKPIQSKTK